jgi:hypothetical protein
LKVVFVEKWRKHAGVAFQYAIHVNNSHQTVSKKVSSNFLPEWAFTLIVSISSMIYSSGSIRFSFADSHASIQLAINSP